MEIDEKTFATICYLVLLDHHGAGFFKNAHPSYITEKLQLLNRGFDAYGALDRDNQENVKRFLVLWKYQMPEKIAAYEKELQDAGIF